MARSASAPPAHARAGGPGGGRQHRPAHRVARLAGRLAWACHSQADGTVAIEPALLDYQRMTQELAPFQPSLFVQGATVGPAGRSGLRRLRRPVPERGVLRRRPPAPPAHGTDPAQRSGPRERQDSRLPHDVRPAVADRVLRRRSVHAGLGDRHPRRCPGRPGQAHCTIAGAGHFLQEDQGPALAAAIIEFVERTPRRRGSG